MLETVSRWFWNPNFWLPPNLSWADLISNEKVQYTDSRDLIYSMPLCVGLLVLRYLLERYCYSRFGQSLGIRPKRTTNIPLHPELERLLKVNAKPGPKEIEKGAALLSKSEREIARWFRIRRMNKKPSKLRKFCEDSFRFTYYSFSFAFGLSVLWNKEWLWNTQACWYSYPHQSIDNGIWWYYIINLSFISSLTISHFFDVKRQDFWPMFVHHIATIIMLSLSWICNMTRIASLVLIVHDFADIFLEAAKMAMYAKYQRLRDALFIIFTMSWTVTRLGMFPFLIHKSIFVASQTMTMFPAMWITQILSILLLILHLYWTYLIIKLIRNAIHERKFNADIRSSSDDEDYLNDELHQDEQKNEIKKEK